MPQLHIHLTPLLAACGWALGSHVSARKPAVNPGVNRSCSELHDLYPDVLLLPESERYTFESTNVWDKRSNASPACIFLPETAEQAAVGVRTFHANDAPFAVRGGGHMPVPGSNSIADGILVVLDGLSDINIAEDESTVNVGPGNRWIGIYEALAPKELYAMGGRLGGIGVSGLSLIGGIGFFTNKYGFGMDNIVSYDVILGNGTQVKASSSSNRDLFWALKGGSGNYGLVTNFELKLFRMPLASSTTQIFPEAAAPDFIRAACDFALYDDGSVAAGGVFNVNYNVTTKSATLNVFGLEESTISPPRRFANFTAIPNPLVRSGSVVAPVNYHRGFASPHQMFRVTFGHHTIEPNAKQLLHIFNTWKQAIKQVEDVQGIRPTLVFNMAPRTAARVAKTNGIGNTYGLDDKKSYIWWQFVTSWANAEDDARVTTWSRSLLERLHAENRAKGLSAEFLYAGDAAEWQNVFGTFPRVNRRKMRQIRDKYDPDLVFTNLNSGGFKLS
ncbi:hypothetical protein ACJ41O_014989 [Fusarium nematophilum]